MSQDEPPLRTYWALPGQPERDLAFEEALLAPGEPSPPTLFLYAWSQPVLVLGCGQRREEVDVETCRRLGIPILRRASGGTAVLHRNDLSVSLVLPSSHPWARWSIGGLYDRFLDVLQRALDGVGVATERYQGPDTRLRPRSPICFKASGRETLLVEGRKAIGCAQARRRGAVLVHGMLLLHLDAALQAEAFGVSPQRIAASLAPLPPLDREALCNRLVAEFREALGLKALEERAVPGGSPKAWEGPEESIR